MAKLKLVFVEAAYTRAFTKMAIEQFVTAVLPQHSRSIYDRFLDAEEKELEKYTIVSSAQEIKTIKSAAQASVDAVFKNIEHIGMVTLFQLHLIIYN